VRVAAHPLIAQVDQDVVLSPTWLARLAREFDDVQVAAAQGRYLPDARQDSWSRVMALDLALRYHRLPATTNHVCTGNSVYRRSALLEVGLFDESLGYGYDNDLSYRLVDAGYRLAYCHDAGSVHHWREGIVEYARQQYGLGYGRLNLLARHPRRIAGDDVSGLPMMLQGPVTAVVVAAGATAVTAAGAGVSAAVPASVAFALAATLLAERFVAGLRAAVLFRDLAGLYFVPVHSVRNLAWVAAMTAWSARTTFRVRSRPVHSMQPRLAEAPVARRRPGARGA
jgi:hypothetical protein